MSRAGKSPSPGAVSRCLGVIVAGGLLRQLRGAGPLFTMSTASQTQETLLAPMVRP